MLEFIREYIKNPKSIGAIAPSGAALAGKMIKPIDFEKAKYIVEYGPGLGTFTKEILRRMSDDTKLILIERNARFYEKLKEYYGGRHGIVLIHGDAADVNNHLAQMGIDNVDFVISGLPFTSLPKEVSHKVLEETATAIGDEGEFVTFQYTLLKMGLFEKYFDLCGYLREMKNLPPAHVLVMRSKRRTAK